MICERCEQAPATRAISRIENGQKVLVYCCEACAAEKPVPTLNRPCAQCKQREGTIKFTRLRPRGRVVTYLCDRCAAGR